jgi:hypothetical protein
MFNLRHDFRHLSWGSWCVYVIFRWKMMVLDLVFRKNERKDLASHGSCPQTNHWDQWSHGTKEKDLAYVT